MQSYREMHHSILPMFPPQTGQCQASSRACAVLCLVAQSCSTLCDSMDYSPSSSSVHGDSPGKNTRVGCHALLQGICPTQGSNPGLPHCRWIFFYQLIYKGSPLESTIQFSLVAQPCPTLCDPMDYTTPGFPVHHQIPEFTQTHVH